MSPPPPPPPQVMQDWRGTNVSTSGKMAKKTGEALRDRLRFLMTGKASGKMVKTPLKQRGLANKHHMMALDNSIQRSLGLSGIASFASSSAPRPLLATQRRFWVPIEALPAKLQATANGRTRRSCIGDEVGDARRLEVVWSAPRPILCQMLDQGSVGWPSKAAIYVKGQVRGFYECDPAHSTTIA